VTTWPAGIGADALFENGDYDQARSALALATVSQLPDRERLLARSLQLRLDGQLAAAEPVVREAASRFPDDPAIRFELGDWAFHAGSLELAEQELRTAIRLDPTFVPAHRHLVWTLDALGRWRPQQLGLHGREGSRAIPFRSCNR